MTLTELRRRYPEWEIGAWRSAEWWTASAALYPQMPPWPGIFIDVRAGYARTRKEAVAALAEQLRAIGVIE